MQCVKCSGQLSELRAGAVLIDQCSECAGIWFDQKELDAVLTHVKAHDFQPVSAAGRLSGEHATVRDQDDKDGTCPRCAVALERTETLSIEGLFVDRCKTCGGAWLDGGELKRIAADADASAELAFFTSRK